MEILENSRMHFQSSRIITAPVLQIVYLILLPILSILGIQLNQHLQYNVLLFVILMISIIPILVSLNKISKRLYPVALFTISLSLLYCTSLRTSYLWGPDIHQEYYFANLVKINSIWNPNTPDPINAMLEITLLAPIITIISGIPLIWVFKAIYPFLFSTLPVILYLIYEKQIQYKMAFLSVFFFFSVFVYYTEMIGLARQQIAEVFLALIVLLIVEKSSIVGWRRRGALALLFSALLVYSHYAVTYIFMCSAVIIPLLSIVIKNSGGKSNQVRRNRRILTIPFIAYLCITTLCWYIYVSDSKTFNRFINLIYRITHGILTEFLNPKLTQPLSIFLTSEASLFHEITRLLNILMVFFITVGFIMAILGHIKEKFDEEYFFLSSASFILCVSALGIPFLALSMNTTRIYHITLIFLSPFCAIGALISFNFILRASLARRVMALSILLSVFLLFNTGFMYEITKTGPSIVNPKWALEYGGVWDRLELYISNTPIEEIASARWLSLQRDTSLLVYSDFRARSHALNAYAMISMDENKIILEETREIGGRSYLYFRKLNLLDNVIEVRNKLTGKPEMINSSDIIFSLSQNADIIYHNGGSEIYYAPTYIKIK